MKNKDWKKITYQNTASLSSTNSWSHITHSNGGNWWPGGTSNTLVPLSTMPLFKPFAPWAEIALRGVKEQLSIYWWRKCFGRTKDIEITSPSSNTSLGSPASTPSITATGIAIALNSTNVERAGQEIFISSFRLFQIIKLSLLLFCQSPISTWLGTEILIFAEPIICKCEVRLTLSNYKRLNIW